jgi:hypothetical protein
MNIKELVYEFMNQLQEFDISNVNFDIFFEENIGRIKFTAYRDHKKLVGNR